MAFEAPALDSIKHVADHLNALLLPETAVSAESLQTLANKLQQVALHLQQKANDISSPFHPAAGKLASTEASQAADETSSLAQVSPVTTKTTAEATAPSRKHKRKLGEHLLLQPQQLLHLYL